MDINLENGDLVQLNTGYIVEVIKNSSNNRFIGMDLNDGERIDFNINDIECYKKHKLKPNGGDNENYWMFYCGPGYNVNSIIIANWARYELPNIFFDMSEDEIIHKHLYWATESNLYNGIYNGDTFVLFNNINLLPENMKIDAEYSLNK